MKEDLGDPAPPSGSSPKTVEPASGLDASHSIPIAWEEIRAKEIARRVQTEPGFILADGHRLMTCGPHTGHVWRAIAFCEDPTWATAIAQGIEARSGETGTGSVHESPTPQRGDAPIHDRLLDRIETLERTLQRVLDANIAQGCKAPHARITLIYAIHAALTPDSPS